jgi:hypothetical protein
MDANGMALAETGPSPIAAANKIAATVRITFSSWTMAEHRLSLHATTTHFLHSAFE